MVSRDASDYRLTQHAAKRIKQRNLRTTQVSEAIESGAPHYIGSDEAVFVLENALTVAVNHKDGVVKTAYEGVPDGFNNDGVRIKDGAKKVKCPNCYERNSTKAMRGQFATCSNCSNEYELWKWLRVTPNEWYEKDS